MSSGRGNGGVLAGARAAASRRDGRMVWSRFAVVLLCLAFFAQALSSAVVKSPTFDEEFHTARAFAYVRAGDLRMQQNHPPLVSALAGPPLLLLAELTEPRAIAGWDEAHLFTFADELFWRLGHDVDLMLFLARVPIILLGVAIVALTFRWTSELYGWPAGLVATVLVAFSPNLLAHARLVTTDFAVTGFIFVAFYALHRFLRRPSRVRTGFAGLSLGLALSAKLSALLIAPIMLLVALIDVWRSQAVRRPWAGPYLKTLGRFALILLTAGGVVWALYGFEVDTWPGSGVRVPATTYLLNVRALVGHAERGHAAFLMGDISDHGWWYYFPVTMVLKTPILTLVLVAVAAWDTVRRRSWAQEANVIVFPAAYFLFTLTSPLNIGYRYLLPLVPFLCVYASKVAAPGLVRPRWLRRIVLPALLAVYGAVALWLHPHYLAYFNALAGGPWRGYRYLVDSNLDWGQDLRLLKEYLDQERVGEVWLGYFGTADPAYYGIEYRELFPPGSSRVSADFAPFDPAPGWYAISATVLQGPFSAQADVLDWFRRHKPTARLGYSIFVYEVPPNPAPPEWVGLCYGPGQALDDQDVFRWIGRNDVRLVGFDCSQSWVEPAGDGPGLYIVPLVSDGSGTLAAERLSDASVVFRERGLRGGLSYTVYEWPRDEDIIGDGFIQQAWASPILVPSETDARVPLPVPAQVGGRVRFLGYRSSPARPRPGGELVVTTAWRVVTRPVDPALSFFAHLLGRDGVVSVGDGLGFPAIQWIPGDEFVQRSVLRDSEEVSDADHWVQVGVYSLATGERLPVTERGVIVADRLLIGPIWGSKGG